MADNSPEKLGATTGADIAAMGARGLLGAIPFVGAILAESVGNYIPGQRLERILSFCQLLEERVSAVERDAFRERVKSPEGADLLEDALTQAARALSEERKVYIAELLKNGLTAEPFSYSQDKKILWLLGELSDPELVWLVYIGRDYDDGMLEKHADVLSWRVAGLVSSEEEHDAAALQASWRRRLLDLGLVHAARFASTGVDLALTNMEHAQEDGSLEVTQLGRMLMRGMGEELAW